MSVDRQVAARSVSGAHSRRLAWVIATAVVVAVFGFFIPAIADYGDVWEWIGTIGPGSVVMLIVASVINQATYPLATMAVIPGLRLREALVARLAATSVANTIPGGGAAGVAITSTMLRSWGIGPAPIARSVVVTGLANNAVRLALPLAALPILVMSGRSVDRVLEAATIGAVVLVVGGVAAVALFRAGVVADAGSRLVGWVRRRAGLGRQDDGSHRRTLDEALGPGALASVRGRWWSLIGGTLVSQVTLFTVLLVALRAVGVPSSQIHWSEAFAAFALVRAVSLLPITPGGVGVAEAGYAALLMSGMSEPGVERVLAAVLVFRFFTYMLPVPAGPVAVVLWRHLRGWRQAVDDRTRRLTVARYGLEIPDRYLERATCFRCGCGGHEVYRLDPFRVVRCRECRQVFVDPRLNEEGRLALYGAPEYFDDGVYGSPTAMRLQQIWSRGRLDLIDAALGGRSDPLVYEIGCAYGEFLAAAAARGFTVAGLEFSPVAARTASRRLGVDIDVGEVVDLDRRVNADVVAFWDVIEHVPDPGDFLDSARDLVRPGGVMALSCPYVDSIPARLLGARWWSLKPHKHIWHFTVPDVRRMLRERGVEPLRVVRSPAYRANLGRVDSVVVIARKQ